MKSWEDYFPYVLPDVYGCPDPLAVQAIRDSAQEFCQKTWVWQDNVSYEIEEDLREIFVNVPRGASLVSIIYLLDNGKEKIVPENLLIKSQRNPVESEFPAEESHNYNARVALKPSKTSEAGPIFLFNDHVEAIASGAKARLMYDPRKYWGNPELAMLHHQLFRKAIGEEKIKIQKGYSKKTSRVKSIRFV